MKPILITVFVVCVINFSYSASRDFVNDHAQIRNGNQRVDSCDLREAGNTVNGNTSQLLFHPKSGKCYRFGTKGPCGENMIFYHHPSRPGNGFCDCDQGYRSRFPCSDHPVRRMIYIPNLKQCFPVFSQGPCRRGYWLTFEDSLQKPRCEWNPCIKHVGQTSELRLNHELRGNPKAIRNNNFHKFWFYDPKRKSCFETQTRGYCPVGLKLEVIHDSHIPKCRRKLCYSKLTNFRSFLICQPGSRYSYFYKGCVRTYSQAHNYFIIG